MSKERAFVRYTKAGRIVPGSLILTKGSYPSGPGLWTEVTTNLCCNSDNPVSTCEIVQCCIEFDVLISDEHPSVLLEFIAVPTTSSVIFIDWGDTGSSSSYLDDSTSLTLDYTYSTTPEEQLYTVKVCFSNILSISEFTSSGITSDAKITEFRGLQSLQSLIDLEVDDHQLTSLDVSGMLLLEELYADGNPNLSVINISNLPNIKQFYLDNCDFSGSFNFSGYSNLTRININDNDVSSINASGLSNLIFLIVDDNVNLSNLLITGSPNILYLNGSNCALPETQVDAILIQLDNNGLLSGQVSLNGGTNATPSASGLAAAANLIVKGWTVNYNP